MLTLYPGKSLVNNIGVDGSGTHCSATEDFSQMLKPGPVFIEKHVPIENTFAARVFAGFLGKHSSLKSRVKRLLKRLWKRMA
jgi:hypothetical protein